MWKPQAKLCLHSQFDRTVLNFVSNWKSKTDDVAFETSIDITILLQTNFLINKIKNKKSKCPCRMTMNFVCNLYDVHMSGWVTRYRIQAKRVVIKTFKNSSSQQTIRCYFYWSYFAHVIKCSQQHHITNKINSHETHKRHTISRIVNTLYAVCSHMGVACFLCYCFFFFRLLCLTTDR